MKDFVTLLGHPKVTLCIVENGSLCDVRGSLLCHPANAYRPLRVLRVVLGGEHILVPLPERNGLKMLLLDPVRSPRPFLFPFRMIVELGIVLHTGLSPAELSEVHLLLEASTLGSRVSDRLTSLSNRRSDIRTETRRRTDSYISALKIGDLCDWCWHFTWLMEFWPMAPCWLRRLIPLAMRLGAKWPLLRSCSTCRRLRLRRLRELPEC